MHLSRLTRLSRRLRLTLGLGLGVIMVVSASLALVVPRLAHAASLSVTDCSSYAASGGLGDALTTAASNADASNTITFTCDTSGGGIIFPTAFTVAKDLTLDATAHSVTLSGNSATQLFIVSSGATLNLTNLTLTGGSVTGGHGGGAVMSSGTLTVTNCTFTNNSANFGGAIAADAGTVTIITSIFTNNTSGNGGAVALAGPVGSSGTLHVTNSYFAENTVTNNGAPATGGALSVDMDTSTVTIDASEFSNNSTTAGGTNAAFGGAIYDLNGVSGTLDISDTIFFENIASGNTASGGALNLIKVALTVGDSTFSENSAQGTSTTLNVTGGGIYNGLGSSATITGTTFTGNVASGVGGAQGGCILNIGTLALVNSTLTGNSATTSAGNGSSVGGCIENGNALTLTNVTLAGNSVVGAHTAIGSNLFSSGSGTITNSIIANGTGANNCAYDRVVLTDGGHNLDSGTHCGFTAASDHQSTDPRLDPLANNGGSTDTMALHYNSPAIDAGDDSICTTKPVNSVDQRGVTRPQGTHCDIGAYEFIPLPPSTTGLTASATTLTCGQQVTLTATVTGVGATPTGTVTFKDGASTLGTGTLSGSGKATLATKSLGNGAHSLQAVYGGDSHFSGSTSSTKVTVTVTGCQGLGGLGPAPQAPQQPRAPSGKPQAPRGASAAYHGTSDNAPATVGHGTTTPGLPFGPIALFLVLLLALGGGFVGLGLWRRRQARG